MFVVHFQELKDETGRLYKLLSERDLEIRQYKKKNEQQKQLLESAGNGTNEAAALKIVDLSKKVRELTAEVESEKTKCKQWARKCMDLENEVSIYLIFWRIHFSQITFSL